MAETKRMKLSAINDILPPEMVEKVLKLLNYEEINQGRLICRKWREIIDNGKLVTKASGKILRHVSQCVISSIVYFFYLRKDCLHFCFWNGSC